jgi:hypothetical protein
MGMTLDGLDGFPPGFEPVGNQSCIYSDKAVIHIDLRLVIVTMKVSDVYLIPGKAAAIPQQCESIH